MWSGASVMAKATVFSYIAMISSLTCCIVVAYCCVYQLILSGTWHEKNDFGVWKFTVLGFQKTESMV